MPFNPALGVLALQAIPEFIKLGEGISQGVKANRIGENTVRPIRKTNEYYKDFLSNAQAEAFVSGIPGEGQIRNDLFESQAGAMEAISQSQQSPVAMMMGFLGAQENANESIERIGTAGANYRAGQLNNYYNALQVNAQQEDLNWQYNEAAPYDEAMAAKSALEYGSRANIFGGVKGLAQTGVNAMVMAKQGAFKSGAPAESWESQVDPSISNTYDLQALRSNLEQIYGPMTDQQFFSLIPGRK